MQNARFQLMRTTDAISSSHLMFQIAFRNIERQKIIAIFGVNSKNFGPLYTIQKF